MTTARKTAPAAGLLALGAARRWSVSLDESPEPSEWLLELDGPQAYLVIQLDDLLVISRTLRLLQSTNPVGKRHVRNGGKEEAIVRLGRLAGATVSLLRDNEDFPRCFLVAGTRSRSTWRLALEADDIQALIDAFEQLIKDMPKPARR